MTWDGTTITVIRNGVVKSSASGAGAQTKTKFWLNNGFQFSEPTSCISIAGFWNGIALPLSKARELSLNPALLFSNQRRLIWDSSTGAGGVTGTVAYTNANDTSAASGTTTVTGTLAKTNANDTSAASGTTTIVGTLAKTNANDTSAASGTTTVVGTLATTNANDSCAASGTAGALTGTVNYTNNNDSVSAAGWVGPITGTLATTNANDTVAASGSADSGLIGRKYPRRGRSRPRRVIVEDIPKVIKEIAQEKDDITEELAVAQADLETTKLIAHNTVNRAEKIKKLAAVIDTLQSDLETIKEEEALMLIAFMALEL